MNLPTALAALLPIVLAATASAQVQVPINTKATYLRVNNDTGALPAPAIPLTALGITAGSWVEITTVGQYSANGSSDNQKNLACVFSSNPTLLGSTAGVTQRVPGAIAAGPNYTTRNTYYGNLSTDIAEDFLVVRQSYANGTKVRVPAGATHIFLTVFSANTTYFTNNADPNSDYFAVFTPTTPAALQGTAEHCELLTGFNGTTSSSPDVKQATPFSTVNVDLAQRWGISTGQLWAIAATAYNTAGSPPVGPLPGLFLGNNYLLVQYGVMTTAPGQWSFFVPPGYAGTTLLVQGFFLTDTARNGFLSSTDAHRIELQ